MFGVVAIGAPAAIAATPTPYVTKAEVEQVSKGMPLTKVHRIFDTKATQTSYMSGYSSKCLKVPATQSRDYKTKSKWGFVTVDYKKVKGTWKVDSKHAYLG